MQIWENQIACWGCNHTTYHSKEAFPGEPPWCLGPEKFSVVELASDTVGCLATAWAFTWRKPCKRRMPYHSVMWQSKCLLILPVSVPGLWGSRQQPSLLGRSLSHINTLLSAMSQDTTALLPSWTQNTALEWPVIPICPMGLWASGIKSWPSFHLPSPTLSTVQGSAQESVVLSMLKWKPL